MKELGEYGDEFKKKQEELMAKQLAFEVQQKREEELKPIIEKRERVKNLVVSWGIIVLAILFFWFLIKNLF